VFSYLPCAKIAGVVGVYDNWTIIINQLIHKTTAVQVSVYCTVYTAHILYRRKKILRNGNVTVSELKHYAVFIGVFYII